MSPQQALEVFGSNAEIGRVCDLTSGRVAQIMKAGRIPFEHQIRMQTCSDGRFEPDAEALQWFRRLTDASIK